MTAAADDLFFCNLLRLPLDDAATIAGLVEDVQFLSTMNAIAQNQCMMDMILLDTGDIMPLLQSHPATFTVLVAAITSAMGGR